jgi:RNA polymerase sigma-70 factor, ECF subfamily
MSAVSEADAASFVDVRPRLLRIARRVLPNPADADDIVQDAWVRWQETDRCRVVDPAAFLATTTTRLALNVGASARVRHAAYVEPWQADAVDASADPAFDAEQRDELFVALGMLLERLSPTERAVYILREAFDYPHRRIAELLELSEANVRQIVTRARRRLAGDAARDVDPVELDKLVEAFLDAAGTGSLEALEDVLGAAIEPRRLCLAAA